MEYAVELFNDVYADVPPADFESRQNHLQTLLMKALNLEPDSEQANLVLSQHVYNEVYYMEEALRGMKEDTPAEQTKKKVFLLRLDHKYEELLTCSLKAYELCLRNPAPKTKNNCRKVLNPIDRLLSKEKREIKGIIGRN